MGKHVIQEINGQIYVWKLNDFEATYEKEEAE